MAKAKKNLSPNATYVQYGYGQVEGNKLSARYNGKIFASLPCSADINCVENGMFLVYDYAHRMVAKPTAGGVEPLLVLNEVKVYEDRETDADFAMLAENYSAIVYNATADGKYAHYVPGTGANISIDHEEGKVTALKNSTRILTEYDNATYMKDKDQAATNPYGMMARGPKGQAQKVNAIVPRLLKTDIGDIMTTNCIVAAPGSLKVGDVLKVDDNGYLNSTGHDGMEWTVVQVYTMPDLQPGVKLIRTK